MARELVCPLCGGTFVCKRWLNCWCGSVKVPKERLRALKAVTNGCVCPACLKNQNWPA